MTKVAGHKPVITVLEKSPRSKDLRLFTWLPMSVLNPITEVWGQKSDNLRHYKKVRRNSNRKES